MDIKAISKFAPRLVGKSTLFIRKYSPEILTGIGVVGVVATAVMASKATLHLDEVVEDTKKRKEDLKVKLEVHDIEANEYTRQVAKVYTKSALDVIKLYGPTITMGLSSISCIIAAHGIMRRRNAALIAAYKTVEEAFANYRKRVVEELGEDQERDIRFGIREEEITDKDGKKKVVHHINPNGVSPYARFFDETCPDWSPVPEYNLLTLRMHQNNFNDLLRARGHVFLNEIYTELGIPHTKEGALVGWTLGKGGDDYIDFGIYDLDNAMAREFVNGLEHSILLDFNVDGIIVDAL